jgi:hypothetical protein
MKAFSIAAVAALLATPAPLYAQGENMQDIMQKGPPRSANTRMRACLATCGSARASRPGIEASSPWLR